MRDGVGAMLRCDVVMLRCDAQKRDGDEAMLRCDVLKKRDGDGAILRKQVFLAALLNEVNVRNSLSTLKFATFGTPPSDQFWIRHCRTERCYDAMLKNAMVMSDVF